MITNEGEEIFFRTEQVLFEQGQPSTGVYIILEGIVDLWHLDEDGQQVHIASLYDGELLGETSVIENTKRSVTARAGCPTRTLFISAETFRKSLADPLVRFVVHTLTARLKSVYTPTENHRKTGKNSAPPVPAVTMTSPSKKLAPFFPRPLRIESYPFTVGNAGNNSNQAKQSAGGLYLPLPDYNRFAPAHFEFVKRDGEIFVRDLGSPSGTYVHGIKISRYGDNAVARLRPGNSHISISDNKNSPIEFTVTVPWKLA